MAGSAPQPGRIDVLFPSSASRPITRRITSPITPGTTAAVTGIVFPSPLESASSEPQSSSHRRPRPLRRMSRIDATACQRDCVDISPTLISTPPLVDDATALDDLWSSLRAQKELKMNKEHAKVKSLEEYKPTTVFNHIPKSPSPRPPSRMVISDTPKLAPESPPTTGQSTRTRERRALLEDVLLNDRSVQDRDSFFRTPSPYPPIPEIRQTPSPPKAPSPSPKRKKSITLIRTIPEKNYSIAIFDLRNVEREDIRVTYRRDHIVVSWEKWEVENWEEEDCIARRTVERVYHRIIPLPEGTKFRDVYCAMKGEDLLLRYPLVGTSGLEA
ncbi:hypothetical protein R3P38DRAFT_3265120 [Favolaschia claudopus]|uniref:SHSP domain-containing protein n=1 Tax=Favolaschia claudopus TaxID=2862362 RepID=A0AAW0C254_9AGAR